MILSVETSAAVCSVALHDRGALMKTLSVDEPQAHAAKTAILIEKLFEETDQQISLLQAVAVSSGPGSYTGLRIGTSVAKGLCMGLNIPLISVPTLDLLGEAVDNNDMLLCPMIDARRMEVFCKVIDERKVTIAETQALIVDENSFRELLEHRQVLFLGDGAAKCQSVIRHPNARFIDGIVPMAKNMGPIAFRRFEDSQFEDLITFVPFYLKDFQAKKAASFF